MRMSVGLQLLISTGAGKAISYTSNFNTHSPSTQLVLSNQSIHLLPLSVTPVFLGFIMSCFFWVLFGKATARKMKKVQK